jgi:hypothetical protein
VERTITAASRTFAVKRVLGLALSLFATATFISDPAVAATNRCAPVPTPGSGRDTVQVRTLSVTAAPVKKTYKVGDVAKVKVTVSRPAGEDPFGNGMTIPQPVAAPASDVYVGVGVNLGNVFLPGFAVTDVQGKATVKIPLKSYAPPKKAQVSVYAYTTDLDTACLRLEENGYEEYKSMFSVKRR